MNMNVFLSFLALLNSPQFTGFIKSSIMSPIKSFHVLNIWWLHLFLAALLPVNHILPWMQTQFWPFYSFFNRLVSPPQEEFFWNFLFRLPIARLLFSVVLFLRVSAWFNSCFGVLRFALTLNLTRTSMDCPAIEIPSTLLCLSERLKAPSAKGGKNKWWNAPLWLNSSSYTQYLCCTVVLFD